MSHPGKVMRKRLRVAAVVLVLLLSAGAGYSIKSTSPTYLESATVMFSLPKSQNSPNAYFLFAPSLIMSGEEISQILINPDAQRRIRKAGGTADVNLALVNLYNEEYPEYGQPLATLTTASHSAAAAHRTFVIAARLLGHILTAVQAQADVLPRNRIAARIIADTGPVVQAGSLKRAFAGLALLTVVAASLVWRVLGQRDGGDRSLQGFPQLILMDPSGRFRDENGSARAARRRRFGLALRDRPLD
jgi:hypothetical protein